MNGLQDTAINPGVIPLDQFMTVSPSGQWSTVGEPLPSTAFESNFPAQPNGSGLYTTPGTIFGIPTKTVAIAAVVAALLIYFATRKGK